MITKILKNLTHAKPNFRPIYTHRALHCPLAFQFSATRTVSRRRTDQRNLKRAQKVVDYLRIVDPKKLKNTPKWKEKTEISALTSLIDFHKYKSAAEADSKILEILTEETEIEVTKRINGLFRDPEFQERLSRDLLVQRKFVKQYFQFIPHTAHNFDMATFFMENLSFGGDNQLWEPFIRYFYANKLGPFWVGQGLQNILSLPKDTDTQANYEEFGYLYDQIYEYIASNAENLNFFQKKNFEKFLDSHFLKGLYTPQRALELAKIGFLNQKIFIFWLGEFHDFDDFLSNCVKKNLKISEQELADLLATNRIVIPAQMMAVLANKKVNTTRLKMLNDSRLTPVEPDSGPQTDSEVTLSHIIYLLRKSDFGLKFKSQLLAFLSRLSFKQISYQHETQDVIELLVYLSNQSDKPITKYLKENKDAIQLFLRSSHRDFNGYLQSINHFLPNRQFLEVYSTDINNNNISFVKALGRRENSLDTKEKAFKRTLYMMEVMTEIYKPHLTGLDMYEGDEGFRSHITEFSYRLSELLVTHIVYHDTDKEQEYIDIEVKNMDLVAARTQRNREEVNAQLERIDLFARYTDIYKLSEATEWSPWLVKQYLDVINNLVNCNLAGFKILASFNLFMAEKFEKIAEIDPKFLFRAIKNLSDSRLFTERMHRIITRKVFDEEFLGSVDFESQVERVEGLVTLMYYLVINSDYDQDRWGLLSRLLDARLLEMTSRDLKHDYKVILPQVLLLATYESKGACDTSQYVNTLSEMLEYSKKYNDWFEKTDFSEKVGSLLRANYYDFLREQELAEYLRIHYKQDLIALFCLSEKHYFGFTGVERGPVHLTLRLLPYLRFDVRVVSKFIVRGFDKRRRRKAVVDGVMSGVRKNLSRMKEDDDFSFFKY